MKPPGFRPSLEYLRAVFVRRATFAYLTQSISSPPTATQTQIISHLKPRQKITQHIAGISIIFIIVVAIGYALQKSKRLSLPGLLSPGFCNIL
jgi:hypothetical protein